MINKFTHSPVFPIVPCYNERQLLDIEATMGYAQYLVNNGAEILMTTSGTTQFNLLSNKEIKLINESLASNFPDKTVIMGLKAESFLFTQFVIKEYNKSNFSDNVFLMLQYPERYYEDDIIERYFHILAECSDYPLLIHCKPLVHGVTGKTHDYTAELINKICSHKNIVGIKEETSDLMLAYNVVQEIDADIGIIFAGGSQRRKRFLQPPEYKKHEQNSTFLAGAGSLFPIIDTGNQGYLEDKIFKVFFKYGWHPSLRVALQYLKLIPHHDRQPWPVDLIAHEYITKVVDEIKEMV